MDYKTFIIVGSGYSSSNQNESENTQRLMGRLEDQGRESKLQRSSQTNKTKNTESINNPNFSASEEEKSK